MVADLFTVHRRDMNQFGTLLTEGDRELTGEVVDALDGYWKVRLNALFACEPDELTGALQDRSAVVRLVAQTLHETQGR